MAFVAGALLGGAVLLYTGASHAGYMLIFGVSSIGRCFALLLLARVPELEVEAAAIGVRPMAVRPNGASLDAPVLPSLPDQTGTMEIVREAES
jgi:hypothetical protein